jgi:uncharacterized protein (UPF0332 family)
MMTDEEKEILINYRIEQSKNSIKTVELLINARDYNAAVSRIYYGMFYMIMAIAVKHDFETSKHQQLIGWFNKNFVNTNVLPKHYGKLINKTFKSRQESDYEAFIAYQHQEVLQMHTDMIDFIQKLEEYLQ